MTFPHHPAAIAACVVAALCTAPAHAATGTPPAAAAAASTPVSATPTRGADSSVVAHPGVFALATLAAIGFVTRRLRG